MKEGGELGKSGCGFPCPSGTEKDGALTRAEHRISNSVSPQIFIQHLLHADLVLGTGDAAVSRLALCPRGPKASWVYSFCSIRVSSQWIDGRWDGCVGRERRRQ